MTIFTSNRRYLSLKNNKPNKRFSNYSQINIKWRHPLFDVTLSNVCQQFIHKYHVRSRMRVLIRVTSRSRKLRHQFIHKKLVHSKTRVLIVNTAYEYAPRAFIVRRRVTYKKNTWWLYEMKYKGFHVIKII